MKVSIITVVYNNEQFIADAIESVLSQSYADIEYIIIDGASGDNTLKIIEGYKDHVAKVVSEKDNGLYDAMNKGIKLATGDVIGILNSDDIYYSNKVIEEVAGIFRDHANADAVYGNLVYCEQANIKKVVRRWITKPHYKTFFEDGEIPPHPGLFVKKKVYDEVGGYNLAFKIAADYEFILRAFRSNRFKIIFINSFLVRMRLGGTSNKNIRNIIQGNREVRRAWKINGLRFPAKLMIVRPFKKIAQYL
ncbi:MAG TPA: glycosyltransferase family 2 protein [Panacibacter sp.]|nr:glycosyltransferase family 2 protein [Panacibacter sp.]